MTFHGLARSSRNKSKVRPTDAFASGQRAKRNGWARLSPYLDSPAIDHFWFAGFDGKDFDSAVDTQIPDTEGNVLVWLRENAIAS